MHGDVSTANILFSATGHPKLADLGVARMLIGQAAADRSLGTPAYVDPVLAAGGAAGAASDVFSLAAVALHCLTGAGPWQSDDRTDSRTVLARAATGVIDDLPGLLAGCPGPMAAVLSRALDPEPHRRGTAAEFALDLGASVRPAPVVLSAGRIPSGVGRHSVDRQAAEAFAVPADLTHVSRPQLRPESVEEPRTGRFSGSRRPGGGLTSGVGLGSGVRLPSWIRLPVRAGAARRPSRPGRVARSASRNAAGAASGAAGPAEQRRHGWSRTVLVALVATLLGGGLAGFLIGGWPAGRHAATAAAPVTGSATGEPIAAVPRAAPASRALAEEPAAVLRRLADLRARAFALNRPDLLSAVYESAALLNQDASQLRLRVPAGCGLTGLRTSYRSIAVVATGPPAATPPLLELRVTASQPAASLICAGVVRAQTLPAAPVRLRLSLVKVGAEFRIAAQRPDGR